MEGVFVWNLFLLHDSRARISMILSCHAQKNGKCSTLVWKIPNRCRSVAIHVNYRLYHA